MKLIFILAAWSLLFFSLNAQPVKIMLVTGGHSYDSLQFFQLFDSLEGIDYEHFKQPHANKALTEGAGRNYDVLVFYDMWRDILEPEKQVYLDLTKQGKPFLFLHHALVSYQNWTEFEKILGGKYVERSSDIPKENLSTYRHDVWIDVEVLDNGHPVTKGMEDFRIFDEVYGNFRVSPDVKPLLKTNHPESTPVIGWENRYNASSIVYLQPGHDFNAYKSDEYRKLLLQAINYLARKK